MANAAAKFDFLIDLPVRNEWANVDLLRTSILNCFTVIFADMEGCHTFAMVAGELLENAIKYGAWERNHGSLLRLRVWGEDRHAMVQVENPVEPTSDAVKELVSTVKWLDGFSSLEEAYRARLLEVAQAPRENLGVSKLGLARIAYEGNCRLHAELDGNTVRVTSRMEI